MWLNPDLVSVVVSHLHLKHYICTTNSSCLSGPALVVIAWAWLWEEVRWCWWGENTTTVTCGLVVDARECAICVPFKIMETFLNSYWTVVFKAYSLFPSIVPWMYLTVGFAELGKECEKCLKLLLFCLILLICYAHHWTAYKFELRNWMSERLSEKLPADNICLRSVTEENEGVLSLVSLCRMLSDLGWIRSSRLLL